MTTTPTTPDRGAFADFTLDAAPVGGTITVNGQDLTEHIRSASVHVNPLGVSVLALELRAAGKVEGRGIVQVIPDGQGGAQALPDAVADLVGSLDPGEVEKAAWERTGAHGNFTRSVLDVVADRAREAVGG